VAGLERNSAIAICCCLGEYAYMHMPLLARGQGLTLYNDNWHRGRCMQDTAHQGLALLNLMKRGSETDMYAD
jgi:hypothetical protein